MRQAREVAIEAEGPVGRVEQVDSIATGVGSIPADRPPARRQILSGLGLVALAVSALVGGNAFGWRDLLMGSVAPEARPAAVSRGGETTATVPSPDPTEETVLQSQPWWQGISVLQGTGTTSTEPFHIGDEAIQWRVTATCETGGLLVAAVGEEEPLAEGNCGTPAVGYGTDAGSTTLEVRADGPWQLRVEQQVDLPLVEPPTPAMSAPGTVTAATGEFYRLDQRETGTVTLFRFDDGSHALRLEDFYVTPNVDLEIRLSPLEAPQSTAEFMSAPSAWVAPLDVTAGSMNFAVPADVDPSQYRSVVIWCPLIDSAYAAAPLTAAS